MLRVLKVEFELDDCFDMFGVFFVEVIKKKRSLSYITTTVR